MSVYSASSAHDGWFNLQGFSVATRMRFTHGSGVVTLLQQSGYATDFNPGASHLMKLSDYKGGTTAAASPHPGTMHPVHRLEQRG